MTNAPSPSNPTPMNSRWMTTTRSTQKTRARSRVRSRFERSSDETADASRGRVEEDRFVTRPL
jgi:hypothetical protein